MISPNDQSAIAYEVTVDVDHALCAEFEDYMREAHVPEVVATGHFTKALFETSESGKYRTRYFAKTQDALDKYLAEDAARLRVDFQNHFPEGVSVSRDVWTVLQCIA